MKNFYVPFYHKKTAYWVISDYCNYRCEYCFTPNKKSNKTNSILIARALQKKLRGEWEIILSGGEPFAHKQFLEIVSRLIAQGFYISVYTNFSASDEAIVNFLKIAGKNLAKFFASLHLSYIRVNDFIKKINFAEKLFSGFKKHVFVHLVATPDIFKEIRKIKKMFYLNGIQLFIFPLLDKNLFFHQYTKKQKIFINEINREYNLREFHDFCIACGSYGMAQDKVNFLGRSCPAGYRSIFIVPTGEAYLCVRSNFTKTGYLGNILHHDFALNKKNTICPFHACSYPASYDQYYWSMT